MDKLTAKIAKHEQISTIFIYSMLLSLLVCIVGLIVFLVSPINYSGSAFLKCLENISDFIMNKIIIWIPGALFVVYFACVAIFSFIGINIGPKNKID